MTRLASLPSPCERVSLAGLASREQLMPLLTVPVVMVPTFTLVVRLVAMLVV